VSSTRAETKWRDELQAYLPPDIDQYRKESTHRGVPGTLHRNSEVARGEDETHPLFSAASQLIETSQDTIQEYTALCRLTKAMNEERPKDLTEGMKIDKEKLLDILEKGKRVSMVRITELMPKDKSTESMHPSSEPWYIESSRYFKERLPGDKRVTKALEYAAKGVSKMAKALPEQAGIFGD
jgi:hypothetical protein